MPTEFWLERFPNSGNNAELYRCAPSPGKLEAMRGAEQASSGNPFDQPVDG
jgi:hypothetical protein